VTSREFIEQMYYSGDKQKQAHETFRSQALAVKYKNHSFACGLDYKGAPPVWSRGDFAANFSGSQVVSDENTSLPAKQSVRFCTRGNCYE
jgi:hypothetical protein